VAPPDDRDTELRRRRDRAQHVLTVDHFAALGVSRDATPDEVNRAFVEAVKTWHPDRVPPGLEELEPLYAQVFGRLDVARATLSDSARRVHYVEEISTPSKRPPSPDLTHAEANLELKKAEILLKKNDVVQAERHLRRAVQLAPGNVTALALLVWLQVKPASSPDDIKRLVSELDRLILLDEKAERVFFFRGQLRKRLGLEKEAYADFLRASELDPSNIDSQREIRLYKMRHERGAETAESNHGVGGFFRKLFKR
jgi:curved DNA-binding protein CbpA